ncbi:MAG TPA: indole-3-glycerol-phosphate synthase, partial [Nitrospirae bacterium]|nr:indole-3-glycerol-phosphate synthase [Nitrospirota bacterium]
MSVLKEILRHKREEVEKRKNLMPLPDLKTRVKDIVATRPFKASVTRKADEPIKLITELKKASPSEGVIRTNFSVPEIISIYDKKEAAAISVLTDKRYFEGSLDYLDEVRGLTKRPLLRKDFIIDDYQVYESRVYGADAVLLIVAGLDKSQLSDLQGLAKELSLDCLVEVHNLKELDTALRSG